MLFECSVHSAQEWVRKVQSSVQVRPQILNPHNLKKNNK